MSSLELNIEKFGPYAPLFLIGPNAELANSYIREKSLGGYAILSREATEPPKFRWDGQLGGLMPHFFMVSGHRGCGKTLLLHAIKAVFESQSDKNKAIYISLCGKHGIETKDILKILAKKAKINPEGSNEKELFRNSIEKILESYNNLAIIFDDIDEAVNPEQFMINTINWSIGNSHVYLFFTVRPYISDKIVSILSTTEGISSIVMQLIAKRPLAEIRRRLMYIRYDHYPILKLLFQNMEKTDILAKWLEDLILKMYILQVKDVNNLIENYGDLVDKGEKIYNVIAENEKIIEELSEVIVDNYTALLMLNELYKYRNKLTASSNETIRILREIINKLKGISFRSELYRYEVSLRKFRRAEIVEYFQYGIYMLIGSLLPEEILAVSGIRPKNEITVRGKAVLFMRMIKPTRKTYERLKNEAISGRINGIVVLTRDEIALKILELLNKIANQLQAEVYLIYIENIPQKIYSLLSTIGKIAAEKGDSWNELIRRFKEEMAEDTRILADNIYLLEYTSLNSIPIRELVEQLTRPRR